MNELLWLNLGRATYLGSLVLVVVVDLGVPAVEEMVSYRDLTLDPGKGSEWAAMKLQMHPRQGEDLTPCRDSGVTKVCRNLQDGLWKRISYLML